MKWFLTACLYFLVLSAVSQEENGEDGEEEGNEEGGGGGYSETIPKTPLVAFFHDEASMPEQAFQFAVNWINRDLPMTTLEPIVQHVTRYDSFNASVTACKLLETGIGAVFGPRSLETVGVIRSIVERAHVPHIQTHWDVSSEESNTMSLNLYPPPAVLAQASNDTSWGEWYFFHASNLADEAYQFELGGTSDVKGTWGYARQCIASSKGHVKALKAVVEDMDWTSYTIIYEEDDALIRLQELINVGKELTAEGHVPFTAWQLPKKGINNEEPDYRPLLKEILTAGGGKIVLDCPADKIITIFRQAREVKMMDHYNSYILTSLDSHTIDYAEFEFGPTNITALRLTDITSHTYQAAFHDWAEEETRNHRPFDLDLNSVNAETALMYDAVNLYAKAIEQLSDKIEVQPITCEDDPESWQKWEWGEKIASTMKTIEMEGMTGWMSFDENGRRKFFSLDIIELTKTGFRKIGSWNTTGHISYTRTTSEMGTELQQSMVNRTFIVVSRIGEPYLRIRDPNAEGNERYEGYSLDLIDEIAKDLNFKYRFVLAPDNNYGSFNKETKQWDGLIRELRERRAHLAICDLTITFERRSAVDFTKPFMTLGISILYSKPVEAPPDLFSFLLPFSINVWIYMATAYLGVSLLLYFLCRCTPGEWESSHPCVQEPEELECSFALHNCLWFSIGSLMQQGCDLLPKALSTRIVAALWWFFVLIMVSSYTANLAAYLTMNRMESTIESVEDLASQTKIKYGALEKGSTYNFFRDSNNSLYQKMWSVMESTRPKVFTKTNDEGVERVLNGDRLYAFFMESSSIEYQIEKYCGLTQVGGLLDSKGYGIAMPQNFQYRIPISGSVLKMQESGKLAELKTKWWKQQSHNRPPCQDTSSSGSNSAELGVQNVGGVFLVVIAGCGFAFLVAILEFLWNVRKVAVNEKLSLKEAFLLELRFALSMATTKPVRYTSPSGSSSAATSKTDESSGDTKSSKQHLGNKVGYINKDDSFPRFNMFRNDS